MQHAAKAYGKIATETGNPRELEADLLLRAAAQLQAVHDGWDANRKDLDAALMFNRKLWTIFVTSVTNPQNPLPNAIRQNIANLGLFIFRHTVNTLANPRPERLGTLININREIAAGLRTRV